MLRILVQIRFDLVYAVRVLRKTPVATAAVICSLALGIAASISFFNVVNAVVLRSLPVPRPAELVIVKRQTASGLQEDFSYPAFEQIRNANHSFAGICAWYSVAVFGRTRNVAEKMSAELVSDDYFPVLGIQPFKGRLPSSGLEGSNEAVISHRYWVEHMGGELSALGTVIVINNMQFTIVGVGPPGFFGLEIGLAKDVWLSMSIAPDLMKKPSLLLSDSQWWVRILGRLRLGETQVNGQAEMTGLFYAYNVHAAGERLSPEREAEVRREDIQLESGSRGASLLREAKVGSLYWLLAASVTIFLIVCSNVALLMISGLERRRREFALRLALGAPPSKLAVQITIETAVLSFLAMIGGLVVFGWASQLVPSMVFGGLVHIDIAPDWKIFLVAFLLPGAFTMSLGLLASWWFSHNKSILDNLRGPGQQSNSGKATTGRLLRYLPLFLQIALSVVLVAQTVLFARTFVNLGNQELGFKPEGLWAFELDPSQIGFTGPRFVLFQRELIDRLRSLASVESVSLSRSAPMSPSRIIVGNVRKESDGGGGDARKTEIQLVGQDYFRTMKIPLLEGGQFSDDGESNISPIPVVINASFARQFFGDASPIGLRLVVPSVSVVVVGVVRDVRHHSLREVSFPVMYVPYLQWRSEQYGQMTILIRTTTAEAAELPSQVVARVREMSQELPLTQVRTISSRLNELLLQERSLVKVTGAMSLLGVLLVGMGTFGLITQAVANRLKELAIRIALGAQYWSAIWLCGRSLALVIVVGLAAGHLLAILITRLTSGLLFGVVETDILIVVAPTLAIIFSAVLGGSLPLAKVFRVNLSSLLRVE